MRLDDSNLKSDKSDNNMKRRYDADGDDDDMINENAKFRKFSSSTGSTEYDITDAVDLHNDCDCSDCHKADEQCRNDFSSDEPTSAIMNASDAVIRENECSIDKYQGIRKVVMSLDRTEEYYAEIFQRDNVDLSVIGDYTPNSGKGALIVFMNDDDVIIKIVVDYGYSK